MFLVKAVESRRELCKADSSRGIDRDIVAEGHLSNLIKFRDLRAEIGFHPLRRTPHLLRQISLPENALALYEHGSLAESGKPSLLRTRGINTIERP